MKWLVFCALSILSLLFSTFYVTQAMAADWVGATGDYSDPGNWSTGNVPNPNENAAINNGGVAQLNSGSADVAELRIGEMGGSGSFEQTDGFFAANGAFVGVNGSGSARISGGEFMIGNNSIHVGWLPGGFGEMTIDGPDAVVTSGDDFQLGREGTGTLDFSAGQLRAGYTVIGKFGTGIWNQSGGLFDQDFGDIEIGDGGRDDQAGTAGPRTGVMNVTGGIVQTADHLAIGNRRGSGTVNVSGGFLAVTGSEDSSIYIGRGADSSPGTGGDTTLRVTGADATIFATGSLIMNPDNVSNFSALITEITGPAHTPIRVAGDADIGNGGLVIELNGYTPMVSDVWLLIEAGSSLEDEIQLTDIIVEESGYQELTHAVPLQQGQRIGEFGFIDDSLAPLTPGLNWEVAYTENMVFLGIGGSPLVTGDFDGNGVFDTNDIDSLMNVVAAGTNDNEFDINADGSVDDLDRDRWLAEAGPKNGFSGPFLVGDANLDGIVDAGDLNQLAVAWLSDNNDWSSGNFTGGGTDSGDLNALALNWRSNVPAAAAAVPEPGGLATLLVAITALGFVARSVRQAPRKERTHRRWKS